MLESTDAGAESYGDVLFVCLSRLLATDRVIVATGVGAGMKNIMLSAESNQSIFILSYLPVSRGSIAITFDDSSDIPTSNHRNRKSCMNVA